MAEQKIKAKVAGLGPKSQDILANIGITTIEQLRTRGSVATYVMARRAGKNVSLNFLWGLESVVSGMHWREIAKNHRTSLLLAVEEYERNA